MWSTTRGQALIAKVILVAIVVAIGACSHFRLIPLLERSVDLRTDERPLTGDAAPVGPESAATAEAPVFATQVRAEAGGAR